MQQINQGMMAEVHEIHELLTYRSQTTTTSNAQASDILEIMSSEIQNVSGAWSPKLLQATFEAELGDAIQVCVTKALPSQKEQLSPVQVPTQQPILPNSSLSLTRRKVWRRTVTATPTQTILGQLRCFVANCEVVERSYIEFDGTELPPRKITETTSNFFFVPARWLFCFGISKGFRLQRTWSNTRCWQATIRTFRVSNLPFSPKYTSRNSEFDDI